MVKPKELKCYKCGIDFIEASNLGRYFGRNYFNNTMQCKPNCEYISDNEPDILEAILGENNDNTQTT